MKNLYKAIGLAMGLAVSGCDSVSKEDMSILYGYDGRVDTDITMGGCVVLLVNDGPNKHYISARVCDGKFRNAEYEDLSDAPGLKNVSPATLELVAQELTRELRAQQNQDGN